MAKKNRKLKVYYGHQKGKSEGGYGVRSDEITVPTIILKGKWLEELGFDIGEKIDISCKKGRLTISVDKT